MTAAPATCCAEAICLTITMHRAGLGNSTAYRLAVDGDAAEGVWLRHRRGTNVGCSGAGRGAHLCREAELFRSFVARREAARALACHVAVCRLRSA